ncbi:MAG TPA: ribosome maturation factor RimM [Thermotogota bacterium]|nr:ribosome maturation factor RimM [Thermotogota bacterium]HRW91824.1 ribosome maturation factor RimM [Thermotogota bacterium]
MLQSLKMLLDRSIPVGRVLGTHGLEGEVKARASDFEAVPLQPGKEYFLFHPQKRRHLFVTLESVRGTPQRLFVRFEEIKSLEDARKVQGFEIWQDRQDLPPLKQNEYYFYQVLDCQVFDENDRFLGTAKDIIETGSADVLQVSLKERLAGKEELLVPMVSQFIVKMDLQAKKIWVRVPVEAASGESPTTGTEEP